MRTGVIFPQLEIGADPGAIRAFAQAVEELGFRHLTAYDHVVGADTSSGDDRVAAWPPGHYTHKQQFHEPLVLFGFLAGVTERIELSTGILILPQRQTVLVAKQAAEVQVLSGGRLRLGVGVGYNHREFEALGVPFEHRGTRMTEQAEVLRAMWADELVSFDARFHRMDRVGLNPMPSAPIPLWMGATSAPGFRRAARCADGWICPGGALAPVVAGWVEQLRAALDAAPPRATPFGIDGRLDVRFRPEDEIVAEAERWRELGATHMSINTMTSYDRRDEAVDADGHIAIVERVRELIGPPDADREG